MLQTFFPYRLAITAEAFSRQLTDVYKTDFGLSREEWRLLFLLAQTDKVTSRELAEMTSLDKVQVSRAADRLEHKDMIVRATPDNDRRLRLYSCTKTGRAVFEQAYQFVKARADAILSNMSDGDRAALERGLGALMTAIENQPENQHPVRS